MPTYISFPRDSFCYFSPVLLFFIWYGSLLMDCGLYDPREVWQALCSPDTLSAASDLLHWGPLCTTALLYPWSSPNTNRNHLDYKHVSKWTLRFFYAFFGCFFVISPHFSLTVNSLSSSHTVLFSKLPFHAKAQGLLHFHPQESSAFAFAPIWTSQPTGNLQ